MTLVILDTSVVMHQIDNTLNARSYPKEHLEGIIKAQLIWVQSCEWLGAMQSDMYKTVWVADTKQAAGYWRHEYLADPANTQDIPEQRGKNKRIIRHQGDPVAYKAGRKLPDRQFNKIKTMAYKALADQKWKMLREPGYEADDIAATIVHQNRQLGYPEDIILATVDADWMGLVDKVTSWFCTYGWFPRVRSGDMEAFNVWAKKRLGQTVTEPRDIWDVKTVKGDKSDNLPPGSPLEVIDLLQPPAEHRLWDRPGIRGIVDHLLTAQWETKVNPETLDRATSYLRSLGIQPVIRPLDPDRDIYRQTLDITG